MESQNQPAESQPAPTPEPMVPLSQVTTIVADEVAKALAQRDEEAAKKAEAATLSDLATRAVPAKESTFPYGNLDRQRQFDLSKFIPGLRELPKDKVMIIIQTYYKDPEGDEHESVKSRRAQFIDLADFIANTKKDPETGDTLYDVMQLRYTVVHDPRY